MEEKDKFKSYDKVIIRQGNGIWKADFYSHYDEATSQHKMTSSRCVGCRDILPYEGNEELVGTSDSPEVWLEEFELLICNHEIEGFIGIFGRLCHFVRLDGDCFEVEDADSFDMTFKFAIRFSDFNPNDMEETKKHILCVKNGKIVKYKG